MLEARQGGGSMRKVLTISACVMVMTSSFAFARPATAKVSPIDRDAEIRLGNLINQARAQYSKQHPKQKIPQLTEDFVIVREARDHSIDMADEQQVNDDGFRSRASTIAANDSGIDPRRMCEDSGRVPNAFGTQDAAQKMFDQWVKFSSTRSCLFDQNGYRTQSAGIGVARNKLVFYFTFIAAHDTTP